MNREQLEEIMEQALYDNAIELDCPECGHTIRCEPDAETSYCYGCDKVVKTENPLIALGLI
jgi:hypothetical protein